MASDKNQNYLHGAAILTVAVVVVKLMGFLYKIPMGNILDDEGYGLFQVAYNLYGVILALSTAGLPVAVARLISEANNLEKPVQVKRIFSVAIGAFVVLGAAGSLAMLIWPTELAIFMQDVRASQSIMALAPSILICCVMSAFRGYSQGLSDMRPTAVSQVIEVGVKVIFGIGMLLIFRSMGKSSAVMSAGATSGVAVGSLAACIYIGVLVVKRARTESARYEGRAFDDSAEGSGRVLKNLVKIGVPIALGSCVFAVIALVSTKIILARLQNGLGLGEESSMQLFGVYSKAQTLYNLPTAIITPLTVSVIPALSGCLITRRHSEAKEVISSSMRISAIITLPMAVGLSVLAAPIMNGLYYGSNVAGGGLLAIMGASSFFLCLALMMQAILQASGKERLPVTAMLIGAAATVGVQWVLVGKPEVGIYGAPIGILICNLIMFGLNLLFIMTKLDNRPSIGQVFLKPLVNSLVMGALAWLIYPAVLGILGAGDDPTRMETLIALVAAVGVAAAAYIVLTIITRAITMEDMRLIPKGEKLAKLLRVYTPKH
ncbi:MAG: polysaccharide biosynthesis protein [Oscillospiraceae bacterium]|nr:polysaccharide biosynthesis protein [Oscillospiraceae bacterium]